MKAIILAAGEGSRMGKLTQNIPKPLVTINGKSIIERQLSILKQNEILDVIIITGPHNEKFNFKKIRYIHDEIGYNFRLTNIQAALGVAQLEQLPAILKRKKEIYDFYQSTIENIKGLSLSKVPNYATNNHWLNLLQIDNKVYNEDREVLMKRLGQNGIQTRPVWKLNHEQKPYKNCQHYKIEKANKLVKSSLCLPSSSNLSNENLNKIVSVLNG